jgi:regulator of protease activity HflC (stomatin/prohibitin superfamily)
VLSAEIKVLAQYERGVVHRFGRLTGTPGPGISFLTPLIERMRKR